MRLEYKIGTVVALVIVGLGTWFFFTRDSGEKTTPPGGKTAAPVGSGAVEHSPPAPVAARKEPSRLPSKPELPAPSPGPMVSGPSSPGSVSGFSLDPNRSTTPGIRSETPLDRPAPSLAPYGPTTRPAHVAVAPTAPETGSPAQPSLPAPGPGTIARAAPPTLSLDPTRSVSPPAAAPTSPTGPTQTHVIKAGDTLSAIAKKYYGSEKYVSLLLESNKNVDPRRLRVGTKILIPPAPDKGGVNAGASAPPGPLANGPTTRPALSPTVAALPRRQPPNTKPYQVKAGDNWQKLAAQFMGSESRWPELFEMNKRSPRETHHVLRAGETIYVPEKSSEPTKSGTRTLIGTSSR